MKKIKTLIFIILLIFILFKINSNVSANSNSQNNNEKISYEIYAEQNYYSYMNNNAFVQNINSDDSILVYYELNYDYSEFTYCNNCTINTVNNNITELNIYRSNIRYYTYQENAQLIRLHPELSEKAYFSFYSPFLCSTYENLANYLSDYEYINSITNNDFIIHTYIIQLNNYDNVCCETTDNQSIEFDFEDVKIDVGVDNTMYSGTNIGIGILEYDKVNSITNLIDKFAYVNPYYEYCFNNSIEYNLEDRFLDFDEIDLTDFNNHTLDVALIAGSKNGIATNCKLYSSNITDFISDLDWFCSSDVVLVNCSFGISQNGYLFLDKVFDFYSEKLGMIFVSASGNDGNLPNEESFVGSPASANNVISVGSYNVNNEISSTTATSAINPIKPLILAPGEGIYGMNEFQPIDSSNYLNGTSFAAPIVSGIIVLILEEFPELIGHPEIIISCLAISSTRLNGNDDLFDHYKGFGKINYIKLREIIESNYKRIYCDSALNSGDSIEYFEVFLSQNERIELCSCILSHYLFVDNSCHFVNSSAFYNCKNYLIEIIDITTNVVLKSCENDSFNIAYMEYTNFSSRKKIGIRIKLLEERIYGDEPDVGSIAYSIQDISPSYDLYSHTIEADGFTINHSHNLIENNNSFYCDECGWMYDYIDCGYIDFFNNLENDSIELINSTLMKIDHIIKFNNVQNGCFTIEFIYNGCQDENIVCYIMEKNCDDYYILNYGYINSINNILRISIDLNSDNYYVACLNCNINGILSVNIERNITLMDSNNLVSDPDCFSLCGSQITVLEQNCVNKSYMGNALHCNFTRYIYLGGMNNTSTSRLMYDWYSSNEEIATISSYGTLFGISAGNVKIMAVNKQDKSIIFVKDFIITDDELSDIIYVENTYSIKYSDTDNGTFTLPIDIINCPYPMIQYYDWVPFWPHEESDYNVTCSIWGTINIESYGCFTLIGTYIYEPSVLVKIDFIVSNE